MIIVKTQEDTFGKKNKDVEQNTSTKIYQVAQMTKVVPNAQTLALYVESLEMYRKDNADLKDDFVRLIDELPSPQKIKKDLSLEECKILYETVGYLWQKITGNEIVEESKLEDAPETLQGSYWMIKNGVLLHGINHYSVIKENASIFSALLNLNGFALQQYLAHPPLKAIEYVLENGGIRIFVDTDRNAYFQMSEETYGEWGRAKVKGFDFNKKIVKIVDFRVPYKGWKSGVAIKL